MAAMPSAITKVTGLRRDNTAKTTQSTANPVAAHQTGSCSALK